MPETKSRDTADIVDDAAATYATKSDLQTAGFAAFFLIGV